MDGSFKRTTGSHSGPARFVFSLVAISLVAILIVAAVLRKPENVTSPTDFALVAVPTLEETQPVPLSTVPIGVRSEHDAAIIQKLDDYFGPLPQSRNPKPIERQIVRGIYILEGRNVDHVIELHQAGYINAVVLDFKESNGLRYVSEIPLAAEIGANMDYPLENTIKRLKDAGIYIIGRVVCFKDEQLARVHPDRAIQDKDGNPLQFSSEGGAIFLNPYDSRNWDYLIELCEEAIQMGADEIQFDYVRFPTGGSTTGAAAYFGDPETLPTRAQAINRFLETARIELQEKHGTPVGADVFSIAISSKIDGNNLGQDWATLTRTGIDNVCPLVYPSHYANESTNHYTGNGLGTYFAGKLYAKPDLHPYDVTKLALIEARVVGYSGAYSTVRPYLQAFTANYLPAGYYMEYDAAAIAQTIAAVYDAGFEEWLLWSPSGQYESAIFTDPAVRDHLGKAAALPES